MDRVELVKPRVECRHPLSPIEFVGHGPLCQRGHVQSCDARLFVKVIRKADVPASHTQMIHTDCRVRTRPGDPAGKILVASPPSDAKETHVQLDCPNDSCDGVLEPAGIRSGLGGQALHTNVTCPRPGTRFGDVSKCSTEWRVFWQDNGSPGQIVKYEADE